MNWSDPYHYVGAVGVVLVLIGIWRTSSGKWRQNSVWYELDTIVGAGLLLLYQIHMKAYIVMPINIALVIISFRGLSSFAERYAVREKKQIAKRLKKRR